MEKLYLVCYDIKDAKRLYKVRKLVYKVAMGGQKSALECYLAQKEANLLAEALHRLIKPEEDRVNIIEIDEDVALFGKASRVRVEDGNILL